MKNNFNLKSKRTFKRLEKKQARAVNYIVLYLLFIPIILTFCSNNAMTYISEKDLYICQCIFNVTWAVTISFGLYSLYSLINTDKALSLCVEVES